MSEETRAKIQHIVPLTDTIIQLIVVPDQYIEYQAGQYLQLVNDESALAYSIANAPLGARHYELHIRHDRDSVCQPLLDQIKSTGEVLLRAPFGQCHLSAMHPQKPILFIAAGTGFAPVNAMIEQLLASAEQRAFELIWSARSQADLYLDEKVKQWQNHVQQFQYIPLLSQKSKKTLTSVVHTRHPADLNDWQIVISGPFDMVYHTRNQLVAHGISITNLYSDAFEFEG